nr:putative swi/snf-related matrix-associated actin-dependent regulator [Quercus suber]
MYSGEMSHDARTRSIAEFRDKPEKKILLCAFKAGGIGLNLTMASRTINLDPWWNASAEQQAFCRVFRIGQDKVTHMTRLVIRHSIDEAMMDMQGRKSEEIDFVIEDVKKRYSIEEIMSLFGEVGTDETGHPFIYPESTESDGEHRMPDVDYEDEQELRGRFG